jgi:transcription elongation GreA/GreB family factor
MSVQSKQDLYRLREMCLEKGAWKKFSDELVKRNIKLVLDAEWADYRTGHAKRLAKKRADEQRQIQLQKEEDERQRAAEDERIRRSSKLGSRSRTRLLFRNSRRVMAGDLAELELARRRELEELNERAVVMFETEREMSKVTKSGRRVRKPKFDDEW